jgi:hypothetical protein
VPLGYFGLLYYLYMFGLVALLAFDPFSRGLRLGALLYAATGVSASIVVLVAALAAAMFFGLRASRAYEGALRLVAGSLPTCF